MTTDRDTGNRPVTEGIVQRVANLAGGSMAGQLVTVLAAPVVTRLYLPGEMGVAALLFTLSALFGTLALLRYEFALLNVTASNQKQALVTLGAMLAVAGALLAPLVSGGLVVGDFLGYGNLPPWSLLFLPPIVFARGVGLMARNLAVRQKAVGLITRSLLAGALTLVLSRILAGWAGGGQLGLYVSQLLGVLVTTGILVHGIAVRERLAWTVNWRRVRALARRYRKFPLFEAPGAALNTVARLLPLPIIAGLFGTTEAGLFGLAYNLVLLPTRHLGRAVADVYHGEAADFVRQQDYPGMKALSGWFAVRMLALGVLLYGGLAAVAPWLFGPLFGEAWQAAGAVVSLLTPWLLAAFVVTPLSRALSLLQRQELKFAYDLLTLGSVLLGYWLARYFNWQFDDFLIYLSITQCVFYALYGLFIFSALRTACGSHVGNNNGRA